MKKYIFYLSLIFNTAFFFLASCKKGSGEGGKASIHGKIKANNYNSTFTTIQATYYSPGENVYIIYGDHITYDNSVKTNYDGTFEFPFLRTGNYTVFAYSKDTTKYLDGVPNPNGSVVSSKIIASPVKITISGKRENEDTGDITIIK